MTDHPTTDSHPVATCATCGHALTVHDAISLRWCAATPIGDGRRACLCTGVVSDAAILTHY